MVGAPKFPSKPKVLQPAPTLSDFATALAATSKVVLTWDGAFWWGTRNGKKYRLSRQLKTDADWEAQIKSIVAATG